MDKIDGRLINSSTLEEKGSVEGPDYVLILDSTTKDTKKISLQSIIDSSAAQGITVIGEASMDDPSTRPTSIKVIADNNTFIERGIPPIPNKNGIAFIVTSENGAVTEISGTPVNVKQGDQIVWTGSRWAVIAIDIGVWTINNQKGNVTIDAATLGVYTSLEVDNTFATKSELDTKLNIDGTAKDSLLLNGVSKSQIISEAREALATAEDIEAIEAALTTKLNSDGKALDSFKLDGSSKEQVIALAKSGMVTSSALEELESTIENKLDINGKAQDSFKLEGKTKAQVIDEARSGNSATASKLTTARTITLTGDASGSASFDGSSDISINVRVAEGSSNPSIGNVEGLQEALDSKVSTSLTINGKPLTSNISLDASDVGAMSTTSSQLVVADRRSESTTTPKDMPDQSVRFTMTDKETPISTMMSKMTVAGWKDLYGVWELGAGSNSSPDGTLWFRYGSSSTWKPWAQVYTTLHKPNKADVGLSNVNNWKASSEVTLASSTTYATSSAVKLAYDLAASKLSRSTADGLYLLKSGTAASAVKLAAARNIILDGGVTGKGSFDGTANTFITTAVSNDSHYHTASTLPSATTSTKGVVQLSSSVSSSSETTAATTKAVYQAYLRADEAYKLASSASAASANTLVLTINGISSDTQVAWDDSSKSYSSYGVLDLVDTYVTGSGNPTGIYTPNGGIFLIECTVGRSSASSQSVTVDIIKSTDYGSSFSPIPNTSIVGNTSNGIPAILTLRKVITLTSNNIIGIRVRGGDTSFITPSITVTYLGTS